MFEENVAYDAGGASFSGQEFYEENKMISEIEDRIGQSGGPAVAFQLVLQKQAIQDRIHFQKWLKQSQALVHIDDAHSQQMAANARTLRRAQHMINGM